MRTPRVLIEHTKIHVYQSLYISAARLWMHWDKIMWIPFTAKEALIRTNWTVSKQKETICGKNRKKKQIPILNIFMALSSILSCVRSDLWFAKNVKFDDTTFILRKLEGFIIINEIVHQMKLRLDENIWEWQYGLVKPR